MARFVDINCPSTFDTHGEPTSLGTRWKKWRQGFDLYLVAAGITDVAQKKALLLHCGGEDLRELFDTLPDPAGLPEGTDAYVKACTALDTYFLPRKNKRYERHVFRICVQKDNESIAQYVTRLRSLAKTCEFHNTDDEIVDQIIEKCNSRKLRKRLLKEHELTLAKLCEIAAIIEAADHQAEQYKDVKPAEPNDDSDQDEINKISNRFYRTKFPKSSIVRPPPERNQTCYRCGSKSHLANACEVTKGKSCHACGKPGHFSNVCKSQKRRDEVRYVLADSSSSDDDFVLSITHAPHSNQPYPIHFNGHGIKALIDSGSTVNVVSEDTLRHLKQPPQVMKYNRKVYAFNTKEPLAVTGCVWATVTSNRRNTSAKFIVVPQSSTTILGYETASALNLLRVGPDSDVVNRLEIPDNPKLHQMLNEYSDRFEGLGKLKDVSLQIQTDHTVPPIAQKARRLPILMQKQVDDELDKLLEYHVIEPVESPPTWVNPLVIVPKKDSSSNGIRMCVDMRAANAAIIREPYQIPTLEELLHEFNGCTVFTKLDLNKGYHQIALDAASRDLTAFATHRGIFRYTRLIFGMSSAAEIYQREIEHALIGIAGVHNISDDIIIGGRNPEELLDRMDKVFQRLREKCLTINRRKCEFLKSELLYMGHKLSAAGVAPDERKIRAIVELKPPSNTKEVRSFLGMVTYCSKFLPNFATVTDPLRQLLQKDSKWNWSKEHQAAFDNLKSLLLSSDTLAYYNPDVYTEIFTDASPGGPRGSHYSTSVGWDS